MKRFLRSLLDGYVHGSLHVSAAVAALLWVVWLGRGATPGPIITWFVVSAVFLSYNFVKHHGSLLRTARRAPLIGALALPALAGFVVGGIRLEAGSLLLVAVLVLVSFLYARPGRWFSRNLRSVPGLKSYLVAFSWVALTAGLGITEQRLEPDADLLWSMLQLFVIVWVWIIPFDVRDLRSDAPDLQTLPQRLGIRSTRWVGFAALACVILLEVFTGNRFRIPLAATVALTAVLLGLTRQSQPDDLASLWVESLPIFWLLAVLLS